MKRLYILLLTLMAFAGALKAQPGHASMRNFEISAGYSYLLTSTGDVLGKMRTHLQGAHVGLSYNWNFKQERWGAVSFEPGVKFSYVMNIEAENEYKDINKTSLRESYVDVPLFVKYSYRHNYFTVLGFIGPEFSAGLTSTSRVFLKKYMVKCNNYTGERTIHGSRQEIEVDGYHFQNYGRYDLRLSAGVGFVFVDRFSLRASYHMGVLNRYNGVRSSYWKRRTNVVDVSLGYKF